jgi:hypothetical protein
MVHTRHRVVAVAVGMHSKCLEAAVVKDRQHDATAPRQRLTDLDLTVVPIETTAELEDPPRSRGTTGVEQRARTQLAVDLLIARSIGLDAGDEESGHSRGRFGVKTG